MPDIAPATTTLPAAPRAVGRVVRGLLALGLGATALTLGSSATVAHVLTRPRRLRRVATRTIDATVEAVTFRTADGLTLDGWYLPHPEARDAIVFCHGFAMNRHELLDLAEGLRARGHAVLLFDFRAHGSSEGSRSTIGYRETEDIAAAVDFLESRPELAGVPLGIAGISMGAAASLLATARDQRIRAVVADSSFAALAAIAAQGVRTYCRLPTYPFAPLILRFGELLTASRISAHRPIDALAAIAPRPVYFMHDSTDTFIPADQTRALYAAYTGPKECWIIPCKGHASVWAHHTAEYIERVDGFFVRTLGTGG